jgi:hypothetical protein
MEKLCLAAARLDLSLIIVFLVRGRGARDPEKLGPAKLKLNKD